MDTLAIAVERNLLSQKRRDLVNLERQLQQLLGQRTKFANAVGQHELLVQQAESAATEYEKFTPQEDFDPEFLALLEQAVLDAETALVDWTDRLAGVDAALVTAQASLVTVQADYDAQVALVASLRALRR